MGTVHFHPSLTPRGCALVPQQEVSSELDKLVRVYDLFREQKEFQESMSAMLWTDLDINALNNGADELEKKCRKFPKVGAHVCVDVCVRACMACVPPVCACAC
jgi:hypothetical protein